MNKKHFIIPLCVLVLFLAACGGGSGGGSGGGNGDDFSEVVVGGAVVLPASSPVEMDAVEVEVLDETASADKEGGFSAVAPEEKIVDATVMLPQRDGDSLPTVYLFSTLLPGETEITIDAEETAVGLLVNAIAHEYLTQAGDPQAVKRVIRQNGDAFIQRFVRQIEQNPYLLRVENLDDVYDQAYMDAASACKTALQEMMPEKTASLQRRSGGGSLSGPTQQPSFSYSDSWRAASNAVSTGSRHSLLGASDALVVKPSNAIDDFVIHADTGNLDTINIGGKMTGSIQIENDSMLFAHYKVTDMISDKLLKDVPEGVLATAFHPDLLGPQGGWSTGFWASTGLYKAGFQSVIVDIYTPGLRDSTWSEYVDGPSFVLGCRTMYSNIFIPVIGMLLPAEGTRIENLFQFMSERGLFEIPMDKWAAGDWGGGAWDFVKKLTEKKLMIDIVTKYLEGVVTDHEVIIKHASKMLVKISAGAKHFEAAGLAVDMGKLAGDIADTRMKIEFHVIFPVSITNLEPATLTKVSDEDDNPVYTLAGTGLDSFAFGGYDYEPVIYLESEDLEGEDIVHNIDAADITVNDDGTALEFQVPFEWAQVGSNVGAAIYVNLIHHFVDYSGIDEVVRVELPEKAAEENFKIDLVSDLAITRLSEDKVSENDDLVLYGKGFAAFSTDNRVFFVDRRDNQIEAEVEVGDETYLKVMVPEGLATGRMRVYVELRDNSRSNEKTLAMRPKMVTADPESGTDFEDDLDVWLFQEQNHDIYYAVDDGDVRPYSGAITLNDGSHIYAFARATIDGVNYDSVTGDFFYYKCAADEELIDGECVGATQSNVWVLQEAAPYKTSCDANHVNWDFVTDFSDGSWQLFCQDKGGGGSVRAGYGSYTVPPSMLAPGKTPLFEVSATLTAEAATTNHFPVTFVDTDMWVVGFREYPLDDDNRLDFTKSWTRLTSGGTGQENHVEVRSDVGGDTNTSTGTVALPQEGWVGWAEYLVINVSGGDASPIGGCEMGHNYIYRWTE
ncbi:MAG: hypothetical protein ACQERN_02180 [Thermodesulfobacteriota bacterium]